MYVYTCSGICHIVYSVECKMLGQYFQIPVIPQRVEGHYTHAHHNGVRHTQQTVYNNALPTDSDSICQSIQS